MYEWVQVTPGTFYMQSPAKVGLIRLNETDVCLVDAGSDKDAGRKIRQMLDARGWRLKAIYNTHSNADHIGGNRYLQTQTGCRVYAAGIERAFTMHPILEPSFLYGGYPPKELRHKFLLAQESDAEELTPSALPQGWEMIPLSGHFFDMVGFRTPDDVVFLADCVSSHETLEKYQIGFVYDVAAYLDTLKRLEGLKARLFIPAHAEPTENIVPLAQENARKVLEIAGQMVELCKEPLCFEEILQRLFGLYNLTMTAEQYALVGSTVRSYLAWLKDINHLTFFFQDNRMLWRRV